jgi:predicted glycosyltransferase
MHQPELTPQLLAAQIDALTHSQPIKAKLDIDGGTTSAAVLEQLLHRS